MPKLIVFNSVSLDGYFTDRNNRMDWAYNPAPDREWDSFVEGNASGGGILVFGRITYEMMASYWPTPAAARSNPVVAERMNAHSKIVFSRTLKEASWRNTMLLAGGLEDEIRSLKAKPGPGLAVLGSGSLVAPLAREGLIDEFQIVVTPVVLGAGRTMLEGIRGPLPLQRTEVRAFSNGNVLLRYVPAG